MNMHMSDFSYNYDSNNPEIIGTVPSLPTTTMIHIVLAGRVSATTGLLLDASLISPRMHCRSCNKYKK